MQHRPDPLGADLALRRHADHRTLHRACHRRNLDALITPLRKVVAGAYIAKPKFHHPSLPKNALGYTPRLRRIGLDPVRRLRIRSRCPHRGPLPSSTSSRIGSPVSGIGCSSKTPAISSAIRWIQFLHGLHAVGAHRRQSQPGADLSRRVGDSDSPRSGGQFTHALRPNVNVSPHRRTTASTASPKGSSPPLPTAAQWRGRPTTTTRSILWRWRCSSAPPSSRARSPATRVTTPLIKAAIEHEGAAFIDVVSPCVAFNNHAGSTRLRLRARA